MTKLRKLIIFEVDNIGGIEVISSFVNLEYLRIRVDSIDIVPLLLPLVKLRKLYIYAKNIKDGLKDELVQLRPDIEIEIDYH